MHPAEFADQRRPRVLRTSRMATLRRIQELVFFFVWRDIQIRYRRTLLGGLWAIAQPLGMCLVFSLFLGRFPGLAPENVPYGLYCLASLVPWMVFAQGTSRCAESVVNNADLIRKVYFPRLVLPISAVLTVAVDGVVAQVLMLVLLPLLGFPWSFGSLLSLIGLWCLLLTATLSLGLWFSALSALYRDIRQVFPFVIQLIFFATPVAYAATVVPESMQLLWSINPMVGYIEAFRAVLLGTPAPALSMLCVSTASTLLVLTLGLFTFFSLERRFADEI